GAHVIRLEDGRHLAWYEAGDPRGMPCLYSPGTPVSGLGGLVYDRPARRAGLRLISVDRPGYGHSDFLPKRRLLDYPSDIEALAEHLRLERFASVGESGGAAFALALARTIPGLLTTTTVLSGMGPAVPRTAGRKMKAENRLMLRVAAVAPWL